MGIKKRVFYPRKANMRQPRISPTPWRFLCATCIVLAVVVALTITVIAVTSRPNPQPVVFMLDETTASPTAVPTPGPTAVPTVSPTAVGATSVPTAPPTGDCTCSINGLFGSNLTLVGINGIDVLTGGPGEIIISGQTLQTQLTSINSTLALLSNVTNLFNITTTSYDGRITALENAVGVDSVDGLTGAVGVMGVDGILISTLGNNVKVGLNFSNANFTSSVLSLISNATGPPPGPGSSINSLTGNISLVGVGNVNVSPGGNNTLFISTTGGGGGLDGGLVPDVPCTDAFNFPQYNITARHCRRKHAGSYELADPKMTYGTLDPTTGYRYIPIINPLAPTGVGIGNENSNCCIYGGWRCDTNPYSLSLWEASAIYLITVSFNGPADWQTTPPLTGNITDYAWNFTGKVDIFYCLGENCGTNITTTKRLAQSAYVSTVGVWPPRFAVTGSFTIHRDATVGVPCDPRYLLGLSWTYTGLFSKMPYMETLVTVTRLL